LEELYAEQADAREDARMELEDDLGFYPCGLCGKIRLKFYAMPTIEAITRLVTSAPSETAVLMLEILETAMKAAPQRSAQVLRENWNDLQRLCQHTDERIAHGMKNLKEKCETSLWGDS